LFSLFVCSSLLYTYDVFGDSEETDGNADEIGVTHAEDGLIGDVSTLIHETDANEHVDLGDGSLIVLDGGLWAILQDAAVLVEEHLLLWGESVSTSDAALASQVRHVRGPLLNDSLSSLGQGELSIVSRVGPTVLLDTEHGIVELGQSTILY